MATAARTDYTRAARLFHALSDEIRLEVIDLLRDGERCVCELTEALDITQTTRGKDDERVARARAFEMRGVWLEDRRTSWSGVRKSDGAVVMALWADAIKSADGACAYLLGAPNEGGLRPWSDTAAGKERLEHCRRAQERGCAEGLLVYGQPLDGHLPEERAYTVHGIDPDTVLVFQVEMRGAEFWATWGKKAAPLLHAA
jgi:hypothetical protein